MICAGISGHFRVEELEYVRSRGNFTLLIFLFRFSPRKRLKHLKVKTLPYTQLDHISDLVTKQVRFQRVRENHVEIGLTPVSHQGECRAERNLGQSDFPPRCPPFAIRRLIIGRFAENESVLVLASSLPLLQDRTRRSGVNRAFLPSRSPYDLYTLSQQTYLTQMPVLFCECVCQENILPRLRVA